MTTIEVVGALASVASVVIACILIAYGRRLALANLRAHIEIVRFWARGPDGDGWDEDRIRPIDRLKWISPQWSVVQNFSAEIMGQLGFLGSIGLSPSLAGRLASVAQSLGSFNAAVARSETFKFADMDTYLAVRGKLTAAVKSILESEGMPADTLTQTQLAAIKTAADLTPREWQWCLELAAQMQSLHVTYIGKRGTAGLHHHLAALEDELRRCYP